MLLYLVLNRHLTRLFHEVRLYSHRMLCCAPNLRVQGFGGELVPSLTLLVVQQHHSVHSAHRELGVVRRPGHACDLGSAILEIVEKTDKTTVRRTKERTQEPVFLLFFFEQIKVGIKFKQLDV